MDRDGYFLDIKNLLGQYRLSSDYGEKSQLVGYGGNARCMSLCASAKFANEMGTGS